MDHQVLRALEGFESSGITIVEWETPLLYRLGYPLAPKPDFLFLVPDDQIQEANQIATASGLQIALEDDLPMGFLSEFAKQGTRYCYDNLQSRFILVPLSWTGIEQDELSIIVTADPSVPYTIRTVPLPAFCAAYLHIIAQEMKGSIVRYIAIADLAAVIAYSMFDMSYEGSYLELPEDREDNENTAKLTDKEILERNNAVERIRGWNFRRNGNWTRDTLIQLVAGELRYEDLPCKQA